MDFTNTHLIKRSRKPHRCVLSGVLIPAGSSYIKMSGTCEGDFYSVVVHPDILDVYNRLNQQSWKESSQPIEFYDFRTLLDYTGTHPDALEAREILQRLRSNNND